jgi:hypothetical protein
MRPRPGASVVVTTRPTIRTIGDLFVVVDVLDGV